jgi:formylglycine-generating enzyme required for sulfatase activity
MKRRTVVALSLLLLVVGGVVAWILGGLPPPRYVLRYGLAPGCEPTGRTVTFEGVEFVEIGPGVSRMGSTFGDQATNWLGRICRPLGLPWGRQAPPTDEMPVHWVEFPRGFWIARTEITNAQYERFDYMHDRWGPFADDDTPVVTVRWDDAKRYCAWLSGRSGREVRLPSESEWECACRAGSDTEYCFGDDADGLSAFAWFGERMLPSSSGHPVASKRPNPWGLYDLHGNVWEWCEDAYHTSYEGAPADGSPWTEGGAQWEPGSPFRLFRGGGWGSPAVSCRSADRVRRVPVFQSASLGFRPAFTGTGD